MMASPYGEHREEMETGELQTRKKTLPLHPAQLKMKKLA
jgi:hypothetical protein